MEAGISHAAAITQVTMGRAMEQCENCQTLAEEVREIRAIVTRIDRELLGEGAGGRMAVHEQRLGSLERWRSRMAGALAVIAAAFTGAISVGVALLSRKH